jgi:hypothetical protein
MKRSFLLLGCAALLGGTVWFLRRSTPTTADTFPPQAPATAEGIREAEPPASPPDLDTGLDGVEASVESAPEPTRVAAEVRPEPPILVSGTVVDDEGKAVERAIVHVPVPDPTQIAGLPFRPGEFRAATDSTGRFELRGSQVPLHALVWATKPGYFDSDTADFVRGTEGVKLVLGRGGLVAGRILLDPGMPMDRIEVQIGVVSAVPIGGASHKLQPPGPGWLVTTPSEDGEFSFKGLSAPTAKLTVEIRDDPGALAEIGTVLVRKIGDPPDPALDPIDLRGRLSRIAIDVRDDEDRPCPVATVFLRDASARTVERNALTQAGRASFLVPSGTYDVEVDCTGWRRAFAYGVRGDQVVRLSKALDVRIALDGNVELPKAPYRLAVGLLVEVHPPRSTLDGIGTVSVGREAAFPVSMPGRHEVAWYLEEGNKRRFLAGIPARNVEVLEQRGEQVLRVELVAAVRRSWEEMVAVVEGENRRSQEYARKFEKPDSVSDAVRRPGGN